MPVWAPKWSVVNTPGADAGDDRESERRLNAALGAEVRGFRNKRGMSQDALAEASGIGKRTLVRIEKGERPVDMDQLYDLCRALNVRPSVLIRAAEEESGIS